MLDCGSDGDAGAVVPGDFNIVDDPAYAVAAVADGS